MLEAVGSKPAVVMGNEVSHIGYMYSDRSEWRRAEFARPPNSVTAHEFRSVTDKCPGSFLVVRHIVPISHHISHNHLPS
jgi:hypothetical protein